ncbi:Reverse transcriptase zinc-binding domain [Macleaya cordata]|uniref:Reverse transcriptase zinc-binding domain n=1 Tax=Macleaya cordata TaxID=56857 RepID=A0A200PQF1_MACCD|nr:Reverse transcriptase zinc-binding domain [Macleaya cordata]
MPLLLSYPRQFQVSMKKEAFVADCVVVVGESTTWDLGFRRTFYDWEQESVGRLMSKINNSHIAIDTKDTMVWIPAESKTFTVQSCYKVLLPRSEEAFPASAVWSTLAPTKVAFTVWAAYFRKLPTVDALKRRGRICPNRCELCYNEEETCDHILLHCKFSWEI